jgi:hypothetical protein
MQQSKLPQPLLLGVLCLIALRPEAALPLSLIAVTFLASLAFEKYHSNQASEALARAQATLSEIEKIKADLSKVQTEIKSVQVSRMVR